MGPPLPVPPSAPAPNVGARLAPRPRWPRYCFTFPGVYFSLTGKKRGGTRDTGAPLSLPGRARCAPDRPGEGSRADPRAQPAPGPPPPLPQPSPGLRLPSLPPLPAPPARPRDTDLATGPLAARLGPSVLPSRRTPLGTHRLLPLLPQRHRQPRSGPSPGPAPSARPAAPGLAERGAKAVASARGTAPGPAPSHHPFPTPRPAENGYRFGGRLGGSASGWWRLTRTCGWPRPPENLSAAGVGAGQL